MGNTFNTGRLINGLFVDASGNVGIGTTTPAEKLSVIGNIRIDNGAADGGQLVLASSGFSDWNLDSLSGRFRAYYGATERFTILANGRVGIGTTTPGYLMEISASSAVVGVGLIINDTNGKAYSLRSDANNLIIRDNTASVDRLTIASSGAATFSSSVTAGARIQAQGSNGAGTSQGGFLINYNANANSRSWLINNDYNVFGDFAILQTTTQTGSTFTAPFYISPSSYIGMGTLSPSSRLTIIRDSPFNTGDQALRIRATDGDGYNLWMGASSNGYATIQSYQDNVGGRPLLLNPLNGGNVGINNSSPTGRLHIYGNDTPSITGTTPTGAFIIQSDATTAMTMGVFPSNPFYGWIQMRHGAVSGLAYGLALQPSGGSVNIGRTSGGGRLNIEGDVYLYNLFAGAGNSTLKYNTSSGLLSFDTSARSFKKDIIELEYGLEAILKMSPKKYKWKSDDLSDLGFIADEMYEIIPEIVSLANNNINKTELEDGEPMGINYDRLVPVLVKAIQELSAKVNSLENK